MHRLADDRETRFALLTAAHRFVISAEESSGRPSNCELASLLAAAELYHRPAVEQEAVFLRTLAALDPHGLSSLVRKYVALGVQGSLPIYRFRLCVEGLFSGRRIIHPAVREAVELIEAHYADATLSLVSTARRLRRSRAAFAVLFKLHTGRTFRRYLREVRLDRAASLLAGGSGSVKEVWTAVGFNDRGSFDRNFRRRFGLSPTEYRRKGAAPLVDRTVPVQECAVSGSAGRRTRILVVEDDQISRETLQRCLVADGHVVEVAVSGEEALSIAVHHSPEVVLLDYHLPGLDGLECARRLRSVSRISPRLVLMTADWDVYDHAAELRRLSISLLTKPCSPDDISVVVTSLCEPTAPSGWPRP